MDDITDENVNTINFEGKHVEGNGDEDVKQLLIDSQVMKFFPPKVLAKFLPNINIINIKQSELKKIRKIDFEPYTSLDTLIINGNVIEEIEANAFERLTLKELDLSYNNMTSLPEKIFSKMNKLQVLRLDFNELVTLDKDLLPCTKKIKEFTISSNLLDNVDAGIVKCLLNANKIDFSKNPCIDFKTTDAKKLFAELMNC